MDSVQVCSMIHSSLHACAWSNDSTQVSDKVIKSIILHKILTVLQRGSPFAAKGLTLRLV